MTKNEVLNYLVFSMDKWPTTWRDINQQSIYIGEGYWLATNRGFVVAFHDGSVIENTIG